MFRIMTPQVLLAAAALTSAACAHGVHADSLAFFQPASSEESTVVVQNDNFAEMDIYAVEGYSRWRLGTVQTATTVTLRVPRALADRPDIQLQAVPRGPYAPFTFHRVPLSHAARVQLRIASVLSMSAVVW
jgi:hypothetical protein